MPHPLTHGIQLYFGELAANSRRVSLVLLGVSAALSLGLVTVGRRLSASDEAMRFGYEGPEQWVERIRLEELAREQQPGLYVITYLTMESRKGVRPKQRSNHPNATPARQETAGEGDDDMDVLAKARMLSLEGPLVRSEDLIIERLVRPT